MGKSRFRRTGALLHTQNRVDSARLAGRRRLRRLGCFRHSYEPIQKPRRGIRSQAGFGNGGRLGALRPRGPRVRQDFHPKPPTGSLRPTATGFGECGPFRRGQPLLLARRRGLHGHLPGRAHELHPRPHRSGREHRYSTTRAQFLRTPRAHLRTQTRGDVSRVAHREEFFEKGNHGGLPEPRLFRQRLLRRRGCRTRLLREKCHRPLDRPMRHARGSFEKPERPLAF